MTSAIETFGLTKRYGAVTAVADLSLRVEPGEVFGFLGPNGAIWAGYRLPDRPAGFRLCR